MAPRTGQCGRNDTRSRLEQAEDFLETALERADGREPSVVPGAGRSTIVTNLIHACIAAADAITCTRLGKMSRDADHASAAKLLAEVPDVPGSLVKRFRDVLDGKTKAGYDSLNSNPSEVKAAQRTADALIRIAREIV